MPWRLDPLDRGLLAGVTALLLFASLVGYLLGRRPVERSTEGYRRTVANLNARIHAWWAIVALCTAGLLLGPLATAALFALVSFLALREFVALVPMKAEDHRTLLWINLLIVPAQAALSVWRSCDLFIVLIPIAVLIFIPTRLAIAGDCQQFLDRAARLQWGVMVCVYCVSFVPALLALPTPTDQRRLLVFFLLIAQLSDVFQYVFGKLAGRHPVAPRVSPGKTWEGLIGGVICVTALGAGLWWITPFRPWQAALISLVTVLLGFAGGLTMSAIKRDYGVKDFGTIIAGHGGVLDRIDSVCFAAPVFYCFTRFLCG